MPKSLLIEAGAQTKYRTGNEKCDGHLSGAAESGAGKVIGNDH